MAPVVTLSGSLTAYALTIDQDTELKGLLIPQGAKVTVSRDPAVSLTAPAPAGQSENLLFTIQVATAPNPFFVPYGLKLQAGDQLFFWTGGSTYVLVFFG